MRSRWNDWYARGLCGPGPSEPGATHPAGASDDEPRSPLPPKSPPNITHLNLPRPPQLQQWLPSQLGIRVAAGLPEGCEEGAQCGVVDAAAEEGAEVVDAWHERGLDIPLVMIESPFRDLGIPLLDEIRKQTGRGDTIVTVVLPELIPAHWWENALHNQTAFYIKRLLLFEPDVVVTSVPFHLRRAPIEVPTAA